MAVKSYLLVFSSREILRIRARGKRLLMITASLDSFGQGLAIWSFSILKIEYTENPLLSVNDNTIVG